MFSLSFATFWVIKKTYGLRVTEEEEDAGLDISEHGMYGYPEQFIPAPELVGYGGGRRAGRCRRRPTRPHEGGARMKMVIAYIRHEAFEPIRTELLELGFPSLSISEVKGSGRQKGITEHYRGAELTNYLRPKVKIECVVADRGTCRRSSTRSSSTRAPGRSATARCSSCRSRRPTGSAPASRARRRSRPTPTRRPGA